MTFEGRVNFHTETLTFKIADFLGTYHAILDQPCYAKFMAIPNYTYLKLKMPDPKGVITVEGSFEQAYYYKQDCVAQGIVVQPRQFLVCFERLGERELVDPGVGARRGSSEGVSQGFWTRQSFTDPGVDACRGIG